jgi:hypothetical protein
MSVAFDSNVDLTVEIGFTSNPYDTTYTYTDVSDYVLKIDIKRGRQQALSDIGTGTCTVVFDNQDRRFDPTNTSSPYSPNVIPNKPIRISAVYDSTTYRLFEGFIEQFPQQFVASGNQSITTVTALDAFALFNLARHTVNEVQELSSVRIANILDEIGWSSSKRDIATGALDVQAVTDDNNALTDLRLTASSEGGEIFMAKDGDVKFNNRRTLILNQTSLGTFGVGAGEIPYNDVALNFDNVLLRNDWRITRVGGTEQIAQDSASITKYGSRVVKRTGQLQVSDDDALSVALQYEFKFAEVGIRVDSMVFSPKSDTIIWTHALGAELFDRYSVKVPMPNGDTLETDVNIQRIAHKIDAKNKTWTWTINTSPANELGAWLLGLTGNSELGTTTRLSY